MDILVHNYSHIYKTHTDIGCIHILYMLSKKLNSLCMSLKLDYKIEQFDKFSGIAHFCKCNLIYKINKKIGMSNLHITLGMICIVAQKSNPSRKSLKDNFLYMFHYTMKIHFDINNKKLKCKLSN